MDEEVIFLQLAKILRNSFAIWHYRMIWYYDYETTETLISRSNKRFYIRRIDWKVRRSPINFPTKLSWKAKTCGPPSTRMFLSFKYQRRLSSTGELPDLVRIHAYARTRVHAIISRALRKVLHPSRRLALAPAPSCALSRDKYLYREHPLRAIVEFASATLAPINS